jgi:hypothetical protein
VRGADEADRDDSKLTAVGEPASFGEADDDGETIEAEANGTTGTR